MMLQFARRVLKVVPTPLAIPLVDLLMTQTPRPEQAEEEKAAITSARKLFYGKSGRQLAWVWGDAGPLVVLVHGWGGSAEQMAPLAHRLAQDGFRCVALEITGHGTSPKRRTRWDYFIRDIAALNLTLNEPVYAYVAHSAGALCMMAARKLSGIQAQRYVCICAPSYPWLAGVEKRLTTRKAVVDRYQQFTAAQFDTTWAQLVSGTAYAGAGSELLLFYDRKDRFLPDTQGDIIRALCPGSTLLKTEQYGHLKVLMSPDLIAAVRKFLAVPTVAGAA
jgi:pimeloyl-ACP methyl ester carboxylesterase